MKRILVISALLFVCISARAQQWENFIIYWDAAKTDTQAAVIAADSLVSQSFKVWPDMTMQVYIQAGDTASATLDSTKVRIYAQFSFEDVAARYRYTWCEVDSIGLDSTQWDLSLGGSVWQDGIDISTNCPARWCRLIAKGLATNSLSDSTKFSAHVERYVND